MTPDDVVALAKAGETFEVEFKGESREPLNDRDLIKNAVCLANGSGGMLLIGIEDDGRISGARPRHESGVTDPYRVQALVANKTQPTLAVSAEVISVPSSEDESTLQVLAIRVPAAGHPVGTKEGLYVRRATKMDGSPECVPFPAHEMLAKVINAGERDYARLPVPGAAWDDLDPLEFERLRTMIRGSGPNADTALAELSDVDIASALGVAQKESGTAVPLAGALLLFGRVPAIQQWIPTHEVMFQVLSGTKVLTNETWRYPLLRVAQEAVTRLSPYETGTELQLGLLRIPIPKLPPTVMRETVMNALIHRDYTSQGPITIQVSDESFAVRSMGGFPAGVRLENLISMTRPRSAVLSESMKRAGLVERTGQGVRRMYESLLHAGRPGPDYSQSNDEMVSVRVPLLNVDLELAQYFAELEQAGHGLALAGLQVLFELRHSGPVPLSEVAQLTQQTEYQARSMLNQLIEQGAIEARGSGRATKYHLSSNVYRALGTPKSSVHVHGFETHQLEQMVISYVQAHGRITRREVMELCAIGTDEASRLLKKMSAASQVLLQGERRGAYYTLS